MGVVFHAPEVYQDRNEHNLMKDFNDEIPGYQRNNELVQVLQDTSLKAGEEFVGENLLTCYEALVRQDFFPEHELELVHAWLEDIACCQSK